MLMSFPLQRHAWVPYFDDGKSIERTSQLYVRAPPVRALPRLDASTTGHPGFCVFHSSAQLPRVRGASCAWHTASARVQDAHDAIRMTLHSRLPCSCTHSRARSSAAGRACRYSVAPAPMVGCARVYRCAPQRSLSWCGFVGERGLRC